MSHFSDCCQDGMNLFCLFLSENIDFLEDLVAGHSWAINDRRWENKSWQVYCVTGFRALPHTLAHWCLAAALWGERIGRVPPIVQTTRPLPGPLLREWLPCHRTGQARIYKSLVSLFPHQAISKPWQFYLWSISPIRPPPHATSSATILVQTVTTAQVNSAMLPSPDSQLGLPLAFLHKAASEIISRCKPIYVMSLLKILKWLLVFEITANVT